MSSFQVTSIERVAHQRAYTFILIVISVKIRKNKPRYILIDNSKTPIILELVRFSKTPQHSIKCVFSGYQYGAVRPSVLFVLCI